MMTLAFPSAPVITVPIAGSGKEFPVHRIYCVGKNYADHIREMGSDPAREQPCFFMKPVDAVVLGDKVPYPPGTRNYHYEGELVLAIGKGGRNINIQDAPSHILGFAAGLDMTRRDLQFSSSKIGMPWDTGKSFDFSAPMTKIIPATDCGDMTQGKIRLWVNDALRQNADLADLIWKHAEVISQLSQLFTLHAGDLVFTGTPAGVGAVIPGDRIRLEIDQLPSLDVEITAPL